MSEESDSETQTDSVKSKDLKKQNDIQSRREARRRKILENAKTRLSKLSGEDSATSLLSNKCNSHSTETYSDPEIDHPEFDNINNFNHNPTYNNTPNLIDWSNSPLLNEFNLNNNNNINNQTKTPPTKFEKFLSTRMHIAAASPLTYLILVLSRGAFIPYVLSLFVALECVELGLFRLEKQLSPIVNIVLMMCGINITKARMLMKVVELLNRMVCDLGLFIFVFVMTDALFTWSTAKDYSEVDEMFNSF